MEERQGDKVKENSTESVKMSRETEIDGGKLVWWRWKGEGQKEERGMHRERRSG